MIRCLTTIILLAFVVVAGVLAMRILSAPPGAPPKTSPAIATPVPTALISREAASTFDQKVDTFQKSATPGIKQRVELALTQQEIASRIEQSLPSGGPADFKDIAVQLKSGGAIISGITSLAGREVPVQADARLFASGGMLGVEIMTVKTGSLDLPQPIVDQLIRQAQQSMGLASLDKIDVGIDVETVDATPDRVRITGQTR